MLTPCLIKPYF